MVNATKQLSKEIKHEDLRLPNICFNEVILIDLDHGKHINSHDAEKCEKLDLDKCVTDW